LTAQRFDVEADVLAADGGSDARYDLCGTFTGDELGAALRGALRGGVREPLLGASRSRWGTSCTSPPGTAREARPPPEVQLPEQHPHPHSAEQIARLLLARALQDGLVVPAAGWADPGPRARSSEELAGVTRLLYGYLQAARLRVGHRLPAEPGGTGPAHLRLDRGAAEGGGPGR